MPSADQRALFCDVEYSNDFHLFPKINVWQNFKTYANSWINNYDDAVDAIPQTETYDYVLCHLPKQKDLSLSTLSHASQSLKEGGLLIAVAANDAGGRKIEGWMEGLGYSSESDSKSKCRIVWGIKESLNLDVIEQYIEQNKQQTIEVAGYNFVTQPGIYGWNKIDRGSEILTSYLPANLSGIGADFGCGYGYLSDHILKNKNIKKLHICDADKMALDCARINLDQYSDKVAIKYHWCDLTQEKPFQDLLDFIVMNPPFHAGKKTDISIGIRFIEQAHKALKPNGTLYFVANKHLPYENTLQNLFSKNEKLCEEEGYKVFKANR